MARPGDRRQRWQSSCNMSGMIMLLISGFFIVAGVTADKGGWIVIILGTIGVFFAFWDFIDAKRGWKMRYDLPPRYYRDIKSPNPITRDIARKAADATMKAAKNPHRKKYAFEDRT